MAKRGKQPNLSFFAFTATPKYKTLEVFGRRDANGKPHPFHLYSMRQAIEEGFILDVLKYYTTYKTYYRLIKAVEDDPKLDKKKAARALARFVSFHPHNLAQKTEVMIEHFRDVHPAQDRRAGEGDGRDQLARCTLCATSRSSTSTSRRRATPTSRRWWRSRARCELDVGDEYTEVGMNSGIREKELPERFASDEYQVLIVAEKYQTGFDQPLLHTMYVDKRLADVQAVQTLSRLNRTAPGKEDTFVLDFVNETEEIQKAFKPYYEVPLVGAAGRAAPALRPAGEAGCGAGLYGNEVEEFAKVFFKPKDPVAERPCPDAPHPGLSRGTLWAAGRGEAGTIPRRSSSRSEICTASCRRSFRSRTPTWRSSTRLYAC